MEFFLFFSDSLKMDLYNPHLDYGKLFPERFLVTTVSKNAEILSTNAFNQGYRLYREGFYEEACKAFENLQESVLSCNWQARCLDKMGAHQDALQMLHKALAASPDYNFTKQNLVRCLRHKKDFLKAIELCNTWFKDRKTYPFLFYELGNCYAEMGLNDNARSCYIKVIKALPSYLHAGYQMGNLYFREGRLEDAEQYYSKLVLVNACYQPAYKGLGNVCLFRGHLDGALLCFEKALDLLPEDPHTLHDVGNVYLHKGEYAKACTYFRRALEQREDCETLFSLGFALMKMNQRKESERVIKRSLELCPELERHLKSEGYAKTDFR